MRREDDRVTRWIADHWRNPHASDPHLWFAMAVARMATNHIPTMEALGYPVPWDREHFVTLMKTRAAAGEKLYNPAYMIATPNWRGNKADFLDQRLLTPMWERREDIAPREGDTLAAFFSRLHASYGAGSFTAAQVVADMKYTPVLAGASDWWTWAGSGPGSRRGLNRVFNRPVEASWREPEWHACLTQLREAVNDSVSEPFHAQDMQNVMCEFDKYERSRLGEGQPKQRYTPFQPHELITL
ncbi:MAG: hypothetical protein EOO77_39950 [Oxalobacteraceae bacterium]|nr:MAG: hypothetical protein EOO77_39950 [Oxalobacteraceae bacterium]